MGGKGSKPEKPKYFRSEEPMYCKPVEPQQSKPEEPKLLLRPWREINWVDKQNVLQSVKDYKPLTEGQIIRILLHGPEGAGKSSFINSVQSVLRGRMYAQALTANISGGSFTKEYTTYKIEKTEDKNTSYPFVFNDIMGLSQVPRVLVDDVKLTLKGHVKEGYRFNPDSKLSENDLGYLKSPTVNDRVHVLVCVFPADMCFRATQEILEKIRDIRDEASHLKIPQVVILTKIDEAHPQIKEDLKNVYKVIKLKEQMEKFSIEVGIPMNYIFPIKNYSEEIKLNDDLDSLILSVLSNIINFGDDHRSFLEIQSGRD